MTQYRLGTFSQFQDLPVPEKLCCALPQEVIGDVLMTLQFLHIFNEVLEMKDHFPNGLNFGEQSAFSIPHLPIYSMQIFIHKLHPSRNPTEGADE